MRLGLVLLRLVLAATALAAAWCWVPLLEAEPVARLGDYPGPHPVAPAWAQTFWIVRGHVVFDVFATPHEAPLAFACLTVILAASVSGLYLSFTAEQRGRFFSRVLGRRLGTWTLRARARVPH